jgi:threonine dehydrogenase-like Zn-dependent dehydrogenase
MESVLIRYWSVVGTQESMMQAINSTRRGGFIGYVGVPHGVWLDGERLFFSHVHLHGASSPLRRINNLIDDAYRAKYNRSPYRARSDNQSGAA